MEGTEEPTSQWLKKLEKESWQLELLVSGFTIFLLIAAGRSFADFFKSFQYEYSGNAAFVGVFLFMIYLSIRAITIFLIVHLLLRGFWIGTIGLRSVNPTMDYNQLKYSDFFKTSSKGN